MDLGEPQTVMAGLGFRHQRRTLDIGCQDGVEDRDVTARWILRHRPDAGAAHQVDFAAVGLRQALDDPKQGRLARAVAADKADLPAVGKSH